VGALCTNQDNKIHDDSVAAAGADYALITTLAVRQVFGALQLANTPGNPYVFLKEISSDGNIQTVSIRNRRWYYLSDDCVGRCHLPCYTNLLILGT